MASCKASFVSILNNDDNPSFTVRSAPRVSRHPTTSPYQYHYEAQQLAPAPEFRYHHAYVNSPLISPGIMRHPFDAVPEPPQPTSPGSSDCSYDYMSSASVRSHYHLSRPDSGAYRPLSEKRISGSSVIDPPSPQPSIGSTKDSMAAKSGVRKNKYPCPFAASHGCSATFTTSGHAARHGKKHTGEKSVHCPICNKAFTRKDNMKQHIRTHRTHSEDMPAGMTTDRDSDGSSSWSTRRSNTSVYNHQRSISQTQMESSLASSGSHRSYETISSRV
ncbi:C2H2 transcription factor [Aspergillus heteromorphus CBS 117.55]|uniref:C2H2 transcription factor n=1 Tax=Aspergillus heteromorphus CBS 117.55 TaxID=1448321 RepID=A0A317WCP4_9EURO|nr:C2H2 transcription factor [Aspergillus heteromorphus CBS 117.55]PWY81930.1 C2H2 transcription factor [Aspergillus heteromorphus CBS 117.55]